MLTLFSAQTQNGVMQNLLQRKLGLFQPDPLQVKDTFRERGHLEYDLVMNFIQLWQ